MDRYTSELEKNYNDICGKAFVNLYTFSKEGKNIYFKDLDLKNKEHLFLLHVAMGLSGIVEKPVVLNKSKLSVWWLNKKLHIRDDKAKILAVKDDEPNGINANEILSFMLPYAQSICGYDFNYGDIYDEFYNLKKKKGKK